MMSRYLKQMMQRYDGDLHLALAAYNYGPRRIPVGADSIPKGAAWYSGYIYRHLGYVLGDGSRDLPSGTPYDADRKIILVEFAAPYRTGSVLMPASSELSCPIRAIQNWPLPAPVWRVPDSKLTRGIRA